MVDIEYDGDGPPVLAGDHADDDGAVIDSFLTETDAPPPAPTTVNVGKIDDTPKAGTRINAWTVALDPAWPTPPMVLPQNLRRKELTITVVSATDSDLVVVASDPRDLMTPTNGYSALTVYARNPWSSFCHTGPVYLKADVSAVTVNVCEVTE